MFTSARSVVSWVASLALAAAASPAVAGVSVGARVDLLPRGRLHLDPSLVGGDRELATNYGLAATVSVDVLPYLSLGVTPRVV